MSRRIHVLVGLLEDANGRILVNRRPAGKHMAGYWEFPGGKRRNDESRYEALARELEEELGIELHSAEPLIVLRHDYPDREVELDVWSVSSFIGEPQPREGQQLRWVAAGELAGIGLLEADLPIVEAIEARGQSA